MSTGYEIEEYTEEGTEPSDPWDDGSEDQQETQASYVEPNLLDVMNNIRESHAAFLGLAVAVFALVGLILCHTLPWISYEGERQEYDDETGDSATVEDSQSIGYGDFDDRENMDRMRWVSERSSNFYEDAADWSIGGFQVLLMLGALTYILAIYQHSGPCSKFFNLIPGTLTDSQKRLLMLHLISGLIIYYSVLSLRAVFRFLQLQLTYNYNSEVFGTEQTIFAGWAGFGVILAAGSTLILGLFTMYSILRAGWSSRDSNWDFSYGESSVSTGQSDRFRNGNPGDVEADMKTDIDTDIDTNIDTGMGSGMEMDSDFNMDSLAARSRKFSLISFSIIIAAIIGLILSLLLPTLLLTTNIMRGEEEVEVLVDDGNIYEFKFFPWYMFDNDGVRSSGVNRELNSWHSDSQFNVNAFEVFVLLGLLSSIGMTLHNFGKRKYFTILYWGSMSLISLLSFLVLLSNMSWIRGAGGIGDELTSLFAWLEGTKMETSFVYNFYPLIISLIAVITISGFIFVNREEIIGGLKLTGDEAQIFEERPLLPVATLSSGGYDNLPMKGIIASFVVLILIAVSFGAFASDLSIGGEVGEAAERPWVPMTKDGERDDGYLDENSQHTYSYWHGIESIFMINFTLSWFDEDDEPFATNDPDEFRLTVEAPWGEVQQSEWVANEHGEEGIIELQLIVEGEPGPTGSLGFFDVTVECGECGDQWYTNPHTIGQADNGNDYSLSHEYTYWLQV